MLSQPYRLRRLADLQRIRQSGRSWRHPLIVLLAQRNDQDVSRFAFVTGRRIGNAVVRNRCKRLMREIVRHRLDNVEAGWDCMLIARNQLAFASYMEVETAVTQLLTRANLLKT
ncbi:MAG: ribonuclease P protein component [Chloroflexi bacterium]|nr:ribonuclease P protein component [Chloroflexota bacterium]